MSANILVPLQPQSHSTSLSSGESSDVDQVTGSGSTGGRAEATAPPARHSVSDHALVHPVIRQQFGLQATASGSTSNAITDIPPVTVTADQVDGEHAADYGGFLESPPPPIFLPDVDEIGQEGDIGTLDPKIILQAYEDFTKLPPKLQSMILDSPTAMTQMVRFFHAGGRIQLDPDLGDFQGHFEGGPPPKITLDRSSVLNAMDGDNDAYENGLLISTLAHELGHFSLFSVGAEPHTDSLGNYLQYRKEQEAMAIINSMIVGAEVEYAGNWDVTLTGYATDSQLRPLYEAFQQNHDLDALVAGLVDLVEAYSGYEGFVSEITLYWNTYYGNGG